MGKTLLVLCLMLSLLSSCSDDKEQYVSFKQSKLEVNFKGGSFIIAEFNLQMQQNSD